MPVRVRADLAAMPDYVPGRKIAGAINLASNEVSYPPPAAIVAAVSEAAASVHRYPAMGSEDLITRVAESFGVDAAQVAIGCGSVALCQQLVQALCTAQDEVLFAWRSFEAYPIVTQVVGAIRHTVPLAPGYRHDLAATLEAINERTRLIFVSNPLNPTGTALRRDELVDFLDRVPEDVLVVLDEAYREFVTDPDVPDGLELARGRQNVAVLRTFSKAYGLAGSRVGFCVASPEVAGGVRKVAIPFSVNRFAHAAALASLEVQDELMERCRLIAAERDRVRDELIKIGFEVPESQANFVWLPLAERATAFNEHCVEQKVVLRCFAGDGVRVTIGTPEENEAMLAAARSFPG
ncbi:histidinol-phosphate transaminase [Crossiella sp. SN42]|uniref:histidinol-phosphate transaminase n=1 Tax=Crossiella sp. SN42 TaxID=2944808 RepID=UPI00207D00D4|nr:histidinol-phosphate transaminase [Crossiella sp. SN42]MCO1581320.1 histidinol-phosphate transaminase [Crossiella sp. SN42]